MELSLLTIVGGSVFLLIAFGVLFVGIKQNKAYREQRHLKIKALYELVAEWFHLVQQVALEQVDEELLFEKEAEVDQYIKDHGFRYEDIYFSPQFRHAYLLALGVDEYRLDDRSLFIKLARCNANKVNLSTLWKNMKSSFRLVYNNYIAQHKEANLDSVERQLMLLKLKSED